MRRALLAISGLAASTSALVVLKGSPGASQVAQDLPADQASVAPGASGPAAPGLTPGPASGSGPAASTRPSAGASRTPGTKTSTTAKATAAPKTTTSAPKTTTTRTVTGPVVSHKYGSVQVRITLSGTRIVDAIGLGMSYDGGSALRSDAVQDQYSGTSGEVVAKQSANLDTVSGATYTSTAYKQSLQAAIDKA